MSRIVVDARMIGAVPHGIARYVKNLAAGLAALPSLQYEPIFLVSRSGREHIPSMFRTETVHADFLSARELIELPRVLKKLSPALYHSPSFSSLIGSPCPWVVTIHDLNHLQFGGRATLGRVTSRQNLEEIRRLCRSCPPGWGV